MPTQHAIIFCQRCQGKVFEASRRFETMSLFELVVLKCVACKHETILHSSVNKTSM